MSVVNTKKLSEPPGGQQFMASPTGKMAGVESHRISYDWHWLPVKGSIVLPFYGFMAWGIDTLLRFSRLSDFPSTYDSS